MRQVSRYWRSQWLRAVRKKQKKLYNYIEDRKCPFHGDLDCEICRVEYFINDKIKMYYEPSVLIVSAVAEITHVELIYHFQRMGVDGVERMAYFDMMYPGLFRYVLFKMVDGKKYHMCRCSQKFREKYGLAYIRTKVGLKVKKIKDLAYYGDDFLEVKEIFSQYEEIMGGIEEGQTCIDVDYFFKNSNAIIQRKIEWNERYFDIKVSCSQPMYSVYGEICTCRDVKVRYKRSWNLYYAIMATYEVFGRIITEHEFFYAYDLKAIPKTVYVVVKKKKYNREKNSWNSGDYIVVDIRYGDAIFY